MSFLESLIERLNCGHHAGNKSQPGVGWDHEEEPSIKRMVTPCQAARKEINKL